MSKMTRRSVLGAALTAPAVLSSRFALGQEAKGPIKVALIAPLSGPWARSGELMRLGAQQAVNDVNAGGGIASKAGRPLQLVVYDAGDSIERAKNAAQRLISQEPEVVAGVGAWLSSFTLAVTEVTERAGLPWLTLSWLDALTERGYKNVFATSATLTELAKQSLPALVAGARAQKVDISRIALVNDGTTPARSYMELLKSQAIPGLNVEVVMDQAFTTPLSDATPLIQRLRTARPNLLVLYSTTTSDLKSIIDKWGEFGLNQKFPIFVPTQTVCSPDLLKSIDATLLEGLLGLTSNWPTPAIAKTVAELRKAGEPWITADTLSPYGEVMLIRDAIERAPAVDKEDISRALLATPSDSSATRFFAGENFGFDAKGRRKNGPAILVQWQKGIPVSVYPSASAQSQLVWPKPS